MANPLYQQMNNVPANPMLQKFIEFKKSFNGNPQQVIQSMLNSGKITQAQINQYAQQADSLYEQLKQFM